MHWKGCQKYSHLVRLLGSPYGLCQTTADIGSICCWRHFVLHSWKTKWNKGIPFFLISWWLKVRLKQTSYIYEQSYFYQIWPRPLLSFSCGLIAEGWECILAFFEIPTWVTYTTFVCMASHRVMSMCAGAFLDWSVIVHYAFIYWYINLFTISS